MESPVDQVAADTAIPCDELGAEAVDEERRAVRSGSVCLVAMVTSSALVEGMAASVGQYSGRSATATSLS